MGEDCFKNMTGGQILMMSSFKKLLLRRKKIKKYRKSCMEIKDSLYLYLAWINISVSYNLLKYLYYILGKYEDCFSHPDSKKDYVLPYLMNDDPYEVTHDEVLKAKWLHENKILHGDFKPS